MTICANTPAAGSWGEFCKRCPTFSLLFWLDETRILFTSKSCQQVSLPFWSEFSFFRKRIILVISFYFDSPPLKHPTLHATAVIFPLHGMERKTLSFLGQILGLAINQSVRWWTSTSDHLTGCFISKTSLREVPSKTNNCSRYPFSKKFQGSLKKRGTKFFLYL